MKDIIKTINYYNNNAKKLIDRYNNANLKSLHNLLLKYSNKEDFVLELGFGIGREIEFLIKNGYKNIYGIDGSIEFVKIVKENFNSENFVHSILPNINLPKNIKFDFIYSIAVWMHLPIEIYEETIKNIVNLLNHNGRVLISFSLEDRNEEERYFHKVDENLLDSLFKKYNMKKILDVITQDGLQRQLKWKNIIYQKVVNVK